jgi:hypothetical protein
MADKRSKAKKNVTQILSIDGLDATISTNGNTFIIKGSMKGDAYQIIKEVIAEKRKEVTDNE